jgi:hypothetical protein
MDEIVVFEKSRKLTLHQWYGDGIWALSFTGCGESFDYLVADDLRAISRSPTRRRSRRHDRPRRHR